MLSAEEYAAMEEALHLNYIPAKALRSRLGGKGPRGGFNASRALRGRELAGCRVDVPPASVHRPRMSTVAEIEDAITRLTRDDAEEIRGWLEQWLEDQKEMTPEFLASIERGKADLAEGRSRTVRP